MVIFIGHVFFIWVVMKRKKKIDLASELKLYVLEVHEQSLCVVIVVHDDCLLFTYCSTLIEKLPNELIYLMELNNNSREV